MSSALSTFRENLKNRIIGSTDGDVLNITLNRVFLGFRHAEVDSVDLATDLINNGPLVIIGMASEGELDYHKTGNISFEIDLYIFKDNETSWDGQDIQDLIADMMGRVLDNDEYVGGAAPNNISISGYDYSDEYKILNYSFTTNFYDPIKKKKKV